MKNDVVQARLPIHLHLLTGIINQIQKMFELQPYLAALYSCMFSLGYYGMLRIREMCKSQHVIKVKDFQVGTNKDKLRLILRSSKTHGRHQKPQIIKLSKQDQQPKLKMNTTVTCPYQNVRLYSTVRLRSHSDKEQFFVFPMAHQSSLTT